MPLSPKEEEIRRSGGIFAVGRREFRKSVLTRPSIDWPDPARRRGDDDDRADRLGAPRRQGLDAARPDARARRCASTPICCRPPTARRRSRSTPSTRSPAAARSIRARRRSPTITSSSPASTPTTSRPRSAASSPRVHGIEQALLRDARRRHLPLLLSRAGAGDAGAVHSRRRLAQPRLRRRTAPSASASARRRSASAGRPATSTSRWRRQRRVVFRGRCSRG